MDIILLGRMVDMDNVEWGEVEPPNFVNVSRVGYKLGRAINKRMITRKAAIANIEQGGTNPLTLFPQTRYIYII